MARKHFDIDLKDWPLEKPLPRRRVPKREDIEAILQKVRRALLRSGCSRDAADDLSITAIEKTYEKWREGGQAWEQLTGYAIVSAINLMIDLGRKNRFEITLIRTYPEPFDVEKVQDHHEIDYSKIELEELINSLPPKERKLILMIADGYNQEEIAKEMGITQSAVSQRLKSLQKQMREPLLGHD